MSETQTNMEPIRLGIHGAIRNGKSTLAGILQEIEPESLYYESSTIISEVLEKVHNELAPPLPEDRHVLLNQIMMKLPPILKNITHVDIPESKLAFSRQEVQDDPTKYRKLFEHAGSLQNDPALLKQPITPETKESHRAGLQGLGGYLVSVSETIWYDEIMRRAKQDSTPDTKLIIVGGLRYPSDAAVVQGDHGVIAEIVRTGQSRIDTLDPTEVHRKQIKSHTRIFNNGDIEDLRRTAKVFYADLTAGVISGTYIASETAN